MSDINSIKNVNQPSPRMDSEDLQHDSSDKVSPRPGGLDDGNLGGPQTLRRSPRRRIQRAPQDQDLVASFLDSGKVRKASTRKAFTKNMSGSRRVARMRGSQEYRVRRLDGVRHRLGQPIEFKVDWVPTWVPFHDLRGEELFGEARAAVEATLGYKTWGALDGPESHLAALDLNEEVVYESE
ncbi:hypothetical protein VFPPC_16914 [Pochonia chlamydosporia 170]|uniref:Uncharacterized protein n=1 Tax=Pochonia chlamydosporia 170 TaxID=1380566 RepID=A0A179F0S1_METCM|nr:hypothetical protein VFPPC_16914 [Pochonia chlamydosporia 170]XP_018137078.1 hypothetical protein VFPPC_11489 [Pochonia chlamydosporia 170]OAQ58994.1 hypothetical protein VFPPC_11489 [Pochonia chlamydosporia 170]OAQ58998.1 hypothetical protein VFPPC_16914 [Pochonia chlamydosporia 170]